MLTGDLSRLQADNCSVIEVVKRQFQSEVDAFLDEVREAIFTATSGASHEKAASGYRYSWIGGSAMATRPEFAAIHRPWNGGPWYLFKAVVTYEKENPVERVSRITASLLLSLNDVYESTARPVATI
jgi:hypothetical protein